MSAEAEKSILGCIVLNPELYAETSTLELIDFADIKNRLIFRALVNLHKRDEEINLITIQACLKKYGKLDDAGGIEYLISVFDYAIATEANIKSYVAIIRLASNNRKLVRISEDMKARIESGDDISDVINSAQKAMSDILMESTSVEYTSMKDAVKEAFDFVEKIYDRKDSIYNTGFYDLDRLIIGGMMNAGLIIVAGRPSMGKTAFAMCVAQNIAEQGGSVAIFSLETTKIILTLRSITAESKVPFDKMVTGNLNDKDFPKMYAASGLLSSLKMFLFDNSNVDCNKIMAGCNKLKKDHGLDLIVVDYLQLIKVQRSNSRVLDVAEITRGLRSIANYFGVPVLALAQLNRELEKRQDKRPKLSDLRESGEIEQAGDVVIGMYRPEVYSDDPKLSRRAEAIVLKQKVGPTGTANLVYIKERMKFENKAREGEHKEW